MFETRAHVKKTIPGCMRGVLRGAFRLAIDEVLAGWTTGQRESTEAWLETLLLGP